EIMNNANQNKQIVQKLIQLVWEEHNLKALKDFWTEDCINHAMPRKDNQGLNALQVYHESLFTDFSAFSNIQIKILQQIAEGDRVVTYMQSRGEHTGTFFQIPPTGKSVSISVIRIDRIQDGKIAEHWSVSDAGSLIQQLQN
ncbi:MAG: ester cyclase, partial [Waterburya sp.]